MPKYKAKTKDCQLFVWAKLGSNEIINERELDFFSRKSIRGLLKAKYIKKLFFTGIEYRGPIGISLSERLKKTVTRYDFFFMMEQVVDLTQKLKKNAMPVNKIVWDINNVYINETTREMQFIYLPIETAVAEIEVIAFIESMIYSAKVSNDENTDYISEFTYFIKSLRKFDAEKIEKYIQQKERSIVSTIKKNNAGQSGFMTDKPRDYYAHYDQDDEATGMLEDDDEETGLLNEDEEETGLLVEDDEGTGLLEEDTSTHYPTLYRLSTEEQIVINKPVFRLGKERTYTDYFVSNNNAVSRSHADIVTRNYRYYIIDLNSKNKTFVNNQVIPVQVETELHNGDSIRLGNEEFVFCA